MWRGDRAEHLNRAYSTEAPFSCRMDLFQMSTNEIKKAFSDICQAAAGETSGGVATVKVT